MSEKKYIQSIQRASDILQFIAEKGYAKLNEISEATGLKTTTTFGILQTLEYVGQVARANNGLNYTLGLNTLKLGISYLNDSGIDDKIHLLLQKIVTAVDETSYFVLKIGKRYYYLDYILSSQPLKVVPDEGKFIDLPPNSAIGRIFYSQDPELKYSTDLEEVYQGTNCFAVPYKIGGKISACIAISGPSNRFTPDKMEEAFVSYQKIMEELCLETHL